MVGELWYARRVGRRRRAERRLAMPRVATREHWYQTVDGAVALTAAQMGYLLEGIDWRNPQQTWRPQAAG